MYTGFSGQGCLEANNEKGLPQFRNYGRSEVREVIPLQHQAIIPSYRFNCSGNITEWGVDLFRNDEYTLELQVWRPSPTADGARRYSLVGQNRFTSISIKNKVVRVSIPTREQVQFQRGDVIGVYVDGEREGTGIAVLTSDQGYDTEEVWYTNASRQKVEECVCDCFDSNSRLLDTSTNVAPVITVSVHKTHTGMSWQAM